MDATGQNSKKPLSVSIFNNLSPTTDNPKFPGLSLIVPGKSPTKKKSNPFQVRRSSAIGIENIQEVQEKEKRTPSIPEGQDLSRSSSNASSFTSVVEENEATEDYDTGMESLSSAGTPHKRDSFTCSSWLEDSVSCTSSQGNSPGPAKTDGGKGTDIRFKLERPHDHRSSSHFHMSQSSRAVRRAWICAVTDEEEQEEEEQNEEEEGEEEVEAWPICWSVRPESPQEASERLGNALRNALGTPWERLGNAWGSP
ncbi:hypothetical protein CRUP_032906 [Coryphaenoides rupestris]|nr:hypothetical protein CRUP_032906 [Coryphaenoides rupestris]